MFNGNELNKYAPAIRGAIDAISANKALNKRQKVYIGAMYDRLGSKGRTGLIAWFAIVHGKVSARKLSGGKWEYKIPKTFTDRVKSRLENAAGVFRAEHNRAAAARKRSKDEAVTLMGAYKLLSERKQPNASQRKLLVQRRNRMSNARKNYLYDYVARKGLVTHAASKFRLTTSSTTAARAMINWMSSAEGKRYASELRAWVKKTVEAMK